MTLGIARVSRRVGLVNENATGSERAWQRREFIAEQAPEDDDQVKGPALGPGDGFRCGFAAEFEREAGFGGALAGDGQGLVGNIGQGCAPAAPGEPEGVATGATSEVEGAARNEIRTRLDQQRVRVEGLRFAAEELRVPAIPISGTIDSHRALIRMV